MKMPYRKLFALLTASTLALAACSGKEKKPDEQPTESEAAQPVHVKVLAFNDLHGHIEGPSGSVTVEGAKVEAGGADHLAARVEEIRKFHPNTAVVTAGDLIGASPLLSSLFHDEPTVESMNAMKLDASAVGNHEFDEGVDELARMQKGGCHPEDGCQDGDDYGGAAFPFLAANVTYEESGERMFDGWFVKEFDGVKVGFIGLTLEGTPEIVSPDGVKGLSFQDEADAINAIVPKLQEDGIETIVVMIHEGGIPTEEQTDVSQCAGVSGPIEGIVERTDEAVDVFVTGHTHQAYICEMHGKLVTAAKSYGRLLTEIDLMVDPSTGDVVEKSAKNLVVDRTGDAHPGVAALIDKYGAIAAPLANEQIGAIEADIIRDANDDGESPLGRLIADIQLDATASEERGRAQIAFMNPGGIRDSFYVKPTGEEPAGVVTYAEAHTVQPFGNSLITMTLTGEQVDELLELQWKGQKRPRILQASRGFYYEWSESAEVGEKVDIASIKLNGEPIDPKGEYRVTVNSYLANGGDGFVLLADGPDRLGGPVDLEALVVYFDENSPIAPPTDRRIKKIK
jgi:5'-nucleotidase